MNLMKIGIQIPLYTLIRITNASNLGTHRVADPDLWNPYLSFPWIQIRIKNGWIRIQLKPRFRICGIRIISLDPDPNKKMAGSGSN